jgi:hypothetical protein
MKYLLLFTILFSNNVIASELIKFTIENKSNNLRLCLTNISKEGVLVNKKMAIGGAADPNEVELLIFNEGGMSFPFNARIEASKLLDVDIILLQPGEAVCRADEIVRLVEDYSLTAGQYRVKAKYKDKWVFKDVFDKPLESDWITFEVKAQEAGETGHP